MEVEAELEAPVSPEALFKAVGDLSGYPAWLDMVRRAERADPIERDDGPAWDVELRGRIGPLARSKRLRMVRTTFRDGAEVRFERREDDDRDHSPWILEAHVSSAGDVARLSMLLTYGGSFGSSLLRRLLRDEIDKARPRLVALASTMDDGPEAGRSAPPGSR